MRTKAFFWQAGATDRQRNLRIQPILGPKQIRLAGARHRDLKLSFQTIVQPVNQNSDPVERFSERMLSAAHAIGTRGQAAGT